MGAGLRRQSLCMCTAARCQRRMRHCDACGMLCVLVVTVCVIVQAPSGAH